jgi:hypothetical protein
MYFFETSDFNFFVSSHFEKKQQQKKMDWACNQPLSRCNLCRSVGEYSTSITGDNCVVAIKNIDYLIVFVGVGHVFLCRQHLPAILRPKGQATYKSTKIGKSNFIHVEHSVDHFRGECMPMRVIAKL